MCVSSHMQSDRFAGLVDASVQYFSLILKTQKFTLSKFIIDQFIKKYIVNFWLSTN